MKKYEIKNIVAVGDIGKKLNLNVLAVDLNYSEYEPQKFNALVYRITSPKATFTIFSSGKFVCVGCSNEKDLETAINFLIKKLA